MAVHSVHVSTLLSLLSFCSLLRWIWIMDSSWLLLFLSCSLIYQPKQTQSCLSRSSWVVSWHFYSLTFDKNHFSGNTKKSSLDHWSTSLTPFRFICSAMRGQVPHLTLHDYAILKELVLSQVSLAEASLSGLLRHWAHQLLSSSCSCHFL